MSPDIHVLNKEETTVRRKETEVGSGEGDPLGCRSESHSSN